MRGTERKAVRKTSGERASEYLGIPFPVTAPITRKSTPKIKVFRKAGQMRDFENRHSVSLTNRFDKRESPIDQKKRNELPARENTRISVTTGAREPRHHLRGDPGTATSAILSVHKTGSRPSTGSPTGSRSPPLRFRNSRSSLLSTERNGSTPISSNVPERLLLLWQSGGSPRLS